MVIIHFRNGSDWFKANWVFRQLAADVARAFPEDSELRSVMDRAEAFGALFLDTLAEPVAARVLRGLKTVVEQMLHETMEGWKGEHAKDKEGRRMYIESLKELSDLIRADEGGRP